MKKKKITIRQQRNEKKMKQKQEIYEKEQNLKQEEFNKLRDEKYEKEKEERYEAYYNLNEESQRIASLINEMYEIFCNWGFDLTSLATNIVKDYPVSTILIDHIKTATKENSSELQLWKLIKEYLVLEKLQVKMNFQDYNKNFRHLLYWGDKFSDMNGIDLLYMIYILLDKQLLKKPNELEGIFEDKSMEIILPEMIATFRNNGVTSIDFLIQDVGNLNILAKRK